MVTLIIAGIVLFSLGGFIQIVEEWRARGLTDTSYKSLCCLAAGPALIGYAAIDGREYAVAAAAALPALLAAAMIALKLRDRLRSKWR